MQMAGREGRGGGEGTLPIYHLFYKVFHQYLFWLSFIFIQKSHLLGKSHITHKRFDLTLIKKNPECQTKYIIKIRIYI